MKNIKIKRVKFITIMAIAILLVASTTSALMLGTNYAFAFDQIEEHSICQLSESYLEKYDYFGIESMSGNNKKDEKGRHITIIPTYPHIFFEGATYIPNAEFFIRNPNHKENTSNKDDDNFVHRFGVCTSVAAQLLISYHNYFTDRRMIPETYSGERFLAVGYGDLNFWPAFQVVDRNLNALCTRIGTTDAMFMDKYDRILWSPNAIFDQTPAYVRGSMRNFLQVHYRDANGNRLDGNVTVTSNRTSTSNVATRARADIDAGRPIILGLDWRTGGRIVIHAVVAFGHHYYYLDGVRTHGFIVHYGWHYSNHHVWIPSTSFDYYIRMVVSNVNHNFVRQNVPLITGNNKQHHTYRCTITGVTQPRPLIAWEQIGNTNNVRVRLRPSAHTTGISLEIPSTFRVGNHTKTVTEIAANGFANTFLSTITLPASVTSIGIGAFQNTPNLTSITFAPNSQLQTIGMSAFANSGLASITLPNTLTSIGGAAFQNTNLTTLTIPSSVTSIGSGAFSGTHPNFGLTWIYNPLTTAFNLGITAFLVQATIPLGTTAITANAFAGSTRLLSISIPSSITHIGAHAFAGTGLVSITIPNTVVHIGDGAFYYAGEHD